MTVSGVVIFLLLQTTLVFAGLSAWWGYKDRIRKKNSQKTVEDLIASVEQSQAEEIEKLKAFITEKLGCELEESESKAKEIAQTKNDLLKSLIEVYYTQSKEALVQYRTVANKVMEDFVGLIHEDANKKKAPEDIVLDTSLIKVQQELEESKKRLNSAVTLANKILQKVPDLSQFKIDPTKTYTLEDLEKIAREMYGEKEPEPETHIPEASTDAKVDVGEIDLESDLSGEEAKKDDAKPAEEEKPEEKPAAKPEEKEPDEKH